MEENKKTVKEKVKAFLTNKEYRGYVIAIGIGGFTGACLCKGCYNAGRRDEIIRIQNALLKSMSEGNCTKIKG